MIGRLTTAVEFTGEEASPWGALKLIGGSANPELAKRISESRPGVGIVTIETHGHNQDRTRVCEFQRSFLVPIKEPS